MQQFIILVIGRAITAAASLITFDSSGFHTVFAVASGFQALERRILCQWIWIPESFAGSLIIQPGLQIPKPRTPDSNSKNSRKKSSQIMDSINKDFPIPESGAPDMGQSTVSYWIVGTQVSAADSLEEKLNKRQNIILKSG